MTFTTLILLGVDLAAALVLSLGLYYRRHHRRDLVVAFLGVNVGVLVVAAVLGTAEVAMGLGLGLFGVLSIIRLRSSEISRSARWRTTSPRWRSGSSRDSPRPTPGRSPR